MSHKLVIVILAALGIAVVSLVMVIGLGGPRFSLTPSNFFADHGVIVLGNACPGSATVTRRAIPWTDHSTDIGINAVGNVFWHPGPGTDLVISGPASAVDAVTLDGHNVSLKCSPGKSSNLTITLPGRVFDNYTLNGFEHVTLKNINQPDLALIVNGAAFVNASGIVHDLKLNVSGAASIDLANMIDQNLDADLSGAGNLTANPTQSAMIDVSGAALVDLISRPRNYHVNVSGLGHIEVPDAANESE